MRVSGSSSHVQCCASGRFSNRIQISRCGRIIRRALVRWTILIGCRLQREKIAHRSCCGIICAGLEQHSAQTQTLAGGGGLQLVSARSLGFCHWRRVCCLAKTVGCLRSLVLTLLILCVPYYVLLQLSEYVRSSSIPATNK
jgi:hypothetical protein